jgi:O-acetyl-ADP-ribose deacetylase (regulator of RNase III)
MPFKILTGDIATIHADVLVNAANTGLVQGSGVCGALFRAAGAEQMRQACEKIGQCPTGDAVITPAFALSAKYVIHTVGPVWQGGSQGERKLLYQCYTKSLRLAEKYGAASIAFPLISAGIFGYPRDRALSVALQAIRNFLSTHDMYVYLVVFDDAAVQMSDAFTKKIRVFARAKMSRVRRNIIVSNKKNVEPCRIEEPGHSDDLVSAVKPSNIALEEDKEPVILLSLISDQDIQFEDDEKLLVKSERTAYQCLGKTVQTDLQAILAQPKETFSEMLLRLIDESGMNDVQVYKRANMDRKLFSKIRSNVHYVPSRRTVLNLAISLRLSLEQTNQLLKKAGYSLSDSCIDDVIIEYFITHKCYDIYRIEAALFAFSVQD